MGIVHQTKLGKIINADCFDYFSEIEDGSVDMVLADLPYGKTACRWDCPLPLDKLWVEYKRIIKECGAIVLTASQPFTTALISSNMEMFKYCWIYEKTNAKGFQSVKYRPLMAHEDICVFYQSQPTYHPQMWECPPQHVNKRKSFTLREMGEVYGGGKKPRKQESTTKYPRSVIPVSNHTPRSGLLHPTQKPLELFKYLIKTYTNEGDLVLDNTAGVCTTGLAAEQLNRNWICIEREKDYCEKGRDRFEI